MQHKGIIRLLTALLILVTLYHLSFTFVTYKIKKQAKEYAKGDYAKENAYLDSMSNEVVYNFLWLKKYTFKECQEREINLGLDLQGGMNVILQISVDDLLRKLADTDNPKFEKAIELAKEREKTTQKDFITLFGEAFKEVAPGESLASIFYTSPELRGKIKINQTNDQVLQILREEAQAAIDNSFNVLRARIDRFGVAQPVIQQLQGQLGRILIELPGVRDEKRVRNILQRTAQLEFYLTYDASEVYHFIQQANAKLREILQRQKYKNRPTRDTSSLLANSDTASSLLDTNAVSDSSLIAQDTSLVDTTQPKTYQEYLKRNPLIGLLLPPVDKEGNLLKGPVVGYAQKKDIPKINQYLNMPEIKALFPKNLKFAWTVKPFDKDGRFYQLIALKTTSRGEPQLTGDVIVDATHEYNQLRGSAEVNMVMNASGAEKWAKLTRENIGKSIAIVLDGLVYSYPVVQSEITGGRSQITGDFTIAEAQDLANVLKSGKLPISVEIVELNHVGPSLGKESIRAGLLSFIIAFVVILLYMGLYYKTAGWVADVALLANMFFIVGVLAALGAVLTLPGIAGIVLTIGMSVDANVIIYERIREELRNGKGLKLAIKDGYKNAYSAIIDANVTTLLTGIILYSFGHGPIRGFATTLIIGILTSLYTAIFITRLIFERLLQKNKPIYFWTKLTKNILVNVNINFLGKRKLFYIISGTLVTISLISIFTRGFDLGVDFVGGRTFIVRFDKPVNTVKIVKSLSKVFHSKPEVKTYGSDNQVKITTKYKINQKHVENEIDSLLYVGLKEYLPDTVSMQTFLQKYRLSAQKVGPTIARDIKAGAVRSVILSLLVIFLYIFIRFRNWQYGLGATVALLHDSIIVMGVFSLLYGILPFSLEIDQAFIAAILTVVGYSVNDTVIIYDRIREYLKIFPKHDRFETINKALNSTLSRTLNTSLTTFFVLLVIFIFGGEVIRGFVFAMLIGIIVGTYSSLYIATPLTFDTIRAKEVKLEKQRKAEEERRKAIQREIQRQKEEEEQETAQKANPKKKDKKKKKKKKKKHK